MSSDSQCFLTLFFLTSVPAQAQLLVDDFNYPADDLLTAHGWTPYRVESVPVSVASGNLSYPGYPSPAESNSVELTQSFDTQAVRRAFTSQSSGSVYASFLLNVATAIPASNLGSAQVVQLGTTGMTTSTEGIGLFTYNDQGKLLFAISKTGGTLISTQADYDFETTNLVVLKYEFNPGSDNDDRISIFLNPGLDGPEPAPVTQTAIGADAGDIAEFGIRGWDFDPDGPDETKFTLDGLRITDVWPFDQPPPPVIFEDGFEGGE